MPEMTLSEAAKWAGVTRPTIHKALKGGRLSGRRDDNGQWLIDPAELERVYVQANKRHVTDDANLYTYDTSELIAGKDRELALIREMLEQTKRQCEKWEAEAAKWQIQAEAQTRILTHETQEQAPASRGIARWFQRKAS